SSDKKVSLSQTSGTASMLGSIAYDALPFVIDADTDDAGLSEGETQARDVLGMYAESIGKDNLIEYSSACLLLPGLADEFYADKKAFGPIIVYQCEDELSLADTAFLRLMADAGFAVYDIVCTYEDCDRHYVRPKKIEELLDTMFKGKNRIIAPSGDVSFLLPSGDYASAPLIAETLGKLITEDLKEASTGDRPACVIAAKDPISMYGRIIPFLEKEGIYSALDARISFDETRFANALAVLCRLAFTDKELVSHFAEDSVLLLSPIGFIPALSDFLGSTYSDMKQSEVFELNASMRADRGIGFEKMREAIKEKSPYIDSLIDDMKVLADTHDTAVFDKCLKRVLDISGGNAAAASEAAVIKSTKKTIVEALEHGFGIADAIHAVKSASVFFGATDAPKDANPCVTVTSLKGIEAYAQASIPYVILCDMDAVSYRVKADESAKDLFLEKLGFETKDARRALLDARRQLFRWISICSGKLYIHRILQDESGEKAYASTMFDELIDAYRADVTDESNLDAETCIPLACTPFSSTAHEGNLQQNVGLEFDTSSGSLQKKTAEEYVDTDLMFANKRLSASSLETYISCPYRWYFQSRLSVSEIDAEFGPKEEGSFFHKCLEEFHGRFKEEFNRRVTPDNLDDAILMMEEIFEEQKLAQIRSSKRDSLIAIDATEEEQLRSIKKTLVRFVRFESTFLPEFYPEHFEFRFGDTSAVGYEVFEYAGMPWKGTIDRIDVDGKGNAVIIDYKGSLSEEFSCSCTEALKWADDAMLPHKIQALVYAQAARRLLGLNVVGVLYVSYQAPMFSRGCYDIRYVGASDINSRALLRNSENKHGAAFDEQYPLSRYIDEVETSCEKVISVMKKDSSAKARGGRAPVASVLLPNARAETKRTR
ncbi:MAG: PD-(D/E)XK nuclease family protein, partial [Eggerthellaceae bacterium]|nr:PD-(D/E)XK nuclease family protein [Eggerthellaceae bacterium]